MTVVRFPLGTSYRGEMRKKTKIDKNGENVEKPWKIDVFLWKKGMGMMDKNNEKIGKN